MAEMTMPVEKFSSLDVSYIVDEIIREIREKEAVALGERALKKNAKVEGYVDELASKWKTFAEKRQMQRRKEGGMARRLMKLTDFEFKELRSSVETKLEERSVHFDAGVLDNLLGSITLTQYAEQSAPVAATKSPWAAAKKIVPTSHFSQARSTVKNALTHECEPLDPVGEFPSVIAAVGEFPSGGSAVPCQLLEITSRSSFRTNPLDPHLPLRVYVALSCNAQHATRSCRLQCDPQVRRPNFLSVAR
ncbi:hypothetical protein CYMTET_51604 [Cymbomonas tetramitiformis]|uniref:Uncharacterized protein n=1 Tax=Cymbomonas tetramitiformis TaxID=36881 RepID=A0AAE0BKT6_9CHLO|nr:hypothetical protein CYMTET_51604 [Cymbomonas tetramitiformis]